MKNIDINLFEHTYSLNFEKKLVDVCQFAIASWELSNQFLLHSKVVITDKKKVCLLTIGKSQRLLRCVYKLTKDGYWPEAEILMRSVFEAQAQLLYILGDNTEKRAKKWLQSKNPRERWPMKEILKNIPGAEKFYESACLYPHSHILSVPNYIKVTGDTFTIHTSSVGGINGNIRAEKVLGLTAMFNAAICESSSSFFQLPDSWTKSHSQLMEMPYYLKQSKSSK